MLSIGVLLPDSNCVTIRTGIASRPNWPIVVASVPSSDAERRHHERIERRAEQEQKQATRRSARRSTSGRRIAVTASRRPG